MLISQRTSQKPFQLEARIPLHSYFSIFSLPFLCWKQHLWIVIHSNSRETNSNLFTFCFLSFKKIMYLLKLRLYQKASTLGYLCLIIFGPCCCMLCLTAEYSEESLVDGVLGMVLGYNRGMLARHFIPFRRMRKRREQIGPALNPGIFLGSWWLSWFLLFFFLSIYP